MAISDAEFEAANRRAAERKATFPAAVSVWFDSANSRIVIALDSGLQVSFLPSDVEGLETARSTDLSKIEISPSGYGIFFPTLDVDLYLPGLLEGFLGSKRWMASQMGTRGGRSTSVAKAEAARENGKLGGRPRGQSSKNK